ncbi:putative phospholipid-transporting ATPase IF [Clonorchis sinensis]|uniref:Phospholipid-transporting ATPase n=1 Tax=Clonorchis sinensis TaxID=79923 RepID=A0A3R7D7T8_CLOSI|nr:putative phospholipid-transporting ATPase IF [Clonorchis sinensis]
MRCCLPRRGKPTQSTRHIYANGLRAVEPVVLETLNTFGDNRIVTSRYTWWNFIALNLFEQFHLVGNFIFLCFSFLFIFEPKAVNAVAFVALFIISLFISLIKEAVYDIFRHIQDKRLNNQRFNVLAFDLEFSKLVWTKSISSCLRVGHVLRCVANQEIPCDMVLLASSESNREVRLTTNNIDGETSVKTHFALSRTHEVYRKFLSMFPEDVEISDVTQFKPVIVSVAYEAPNADFNRFEGNLIMADSNEGESSIPILMENVAFRGSRIYNTSCVIGLVLYTGKDTKLSMNSKKNARKFGSREGRLSFLLALCFAAYLFICVLLTILATVWDTSQTSSLWFSVLKPPTRYAYVKTAVSFSFIAIYLLGVILQVTVDLQLLVNSYLITHDPFLFDTQKGLGSSANTVDITDELGQVEFLFSDKTGTLTLNELNLRACSIFLDDSVFWITDRSIHQERKRTVESEEECGQQTVFGNVVFSDVLELKDGLPKTLLEFLTVVLLCHTVEIRNQSFPSSGKNLTYMATSSDEKALVEGAAKLGLVLISTDPDSEKAGARRLVIKRQSRQTAEDDDGDWTTSAHTEEYVVDATLEFDPQRKQMTVMVRYPDGTFHIHSKGAEARLLEPEICSQSSSELRTLALERANEFGRSGLRTLMYATRQVDSAEYHELLGERERAMRQFGEDRRQALKASTERIESGLSLLAVTGVEDKLQPGVKECLINLREAGMKVWVLTGDKEETAVTVSQLSGHFSESMKLLRITGCREFDDVAECIRNHLHGIDVEYEQRSVVKEENLTRRTVNDAEVGEETREDGLKSTRMKSTRFMQKCRVVSHRIVSCLSRVKRKRKRHPTASSSTEAIGLIIDGVSLQHALHPSLRMAFLDLCLKVTAVLCCRMTPLQKASVVKLVQIGLSELKHGSKPVTAAVGDGGNDVSMILQANVGIGISGEEGKEATRAADFVLPQFRYLQRLLLVHGHWCCHRIGYTILLFYHKCVTWVTINLLVVFYSGFSPTTWCSSIIFGLYNAPVTTLSMFFFGIFERPLTDDQLLENPKLYRLISRNSNLRLWRFLLFVLDGLWQGAVIFYSVYLFLAGGGMFAQATFIDPSSHGSYFDISLCGGSSLVYTVISVNLRVVLTSRDINWPLFGSILFTLLSYLLFLMFYQFSVSPSDLDFQTYFKMVRSPAFWFSLPISVFVANLPALLWRVYSDTWWQMRAQTEKQRIKIQRRMQSRKSRISSFSVEEDGRIDVCLTRQKTERRSGHVPPDVGETDVAGSGM